MVTRKVGTLATAWPLRNLGKLRAALRLAVDIVCSSRELFGADRSALRLAGVLRGLDHEVRLVVPDHRPEEGLTALAEARGFPVDVRGVAIASSGGAESLRAAVPGRGRTDADVTIFNTTAVIGVEGAARHRILMVREWLEPRSPKHRVLALRHRLGLDAVVGISTGALRQWRRCVRGPRVQALIPNWLDDDYLAAAGDVPAGEAAGREGMVCLGRFNAWKGQAILAEAYERAFRDRDDAAVRPSLTFVGAQPGTDFAAAGDAIATRGERWGWRVLPFDRDPVPHLDAAALLVLPSLHPEPFGMVLLEALARGCRVLAFPGGGPDDLAEPFAHALTRVPRGAEALGEQLRVWWDAGGGAQSATDRALTQERLRAGWSYEATLPRWAGVLERVTGAPPG